MAITVGLKPLQNWQDVIDRAVVVGVDTTSLKLESDGSVTGDLPGSGRVILGVMYDATGARGGQGAPLNLLPGLNLNSGVTANADALLSALKDLFHKIMDALRNALGIGGEWLLWLLLAAVFVIIIIRKLAHD